MKSLQERLQNWVDADIAAYELGVTLGLFPEWVDGEAWDPKYKGIFWSANPLGDSLYNVLYNLKDIGILEYTDVAFRWNNNYKIVEI